MAFRLWVVFNPNRPRFRTEAFASVAYERRSRVEQLKRELDEAAAERDADIADTLGVRQHVIRAEPVLNQSVVLGDDEEFTRFADGRRAG